MEVIIKFILGLGVISFVINIFAITGFITCRVKYFLYRKYTIDIPVLDFIDNDNYFTCMLVGFLIIFSIWSVVAISFLIFNMGNYIYSLF